MYIAAPSQELMYEWMAALRQGKQRHTCLIKLNIKMLVFTVLTVAQRRGNQMLPKYHPGFEHQRKWTCCERPYGDIGCTLAGTPPTYKGRVFHNCNI